MDPCMNRRDFLAIAGAAAASLSVAAGDEQAADADTQFYQSARQSLEAHMRDVARRNTIPIENGGYFLLPSTAAYETYRGLWPDDFLFSLMVCPDLATNEQLQGTVALLTDSIVDLEVLPDRIEPGGTPWLSPGITQAMSRRMPMHLPAAWVRLLLYLERRGVTIPDKPRWAHIVKRSFRQIPYSMGLAFMDPQQPYVGWGFQDPNRITGLLLIASVVLHKGLQNAAQLFEGIVEDATRRNWLRQSERIKSNLHRLFDNERGGFVAGSRDCRQFDVWGNGIVYSLATPEQKRRLVQTLREKKGQIFHLGFARQVADPEGWQRMWDDKPHKYGYYTNGGAWPCGTGWVLPAIHDQDPPLARELMTEMLENLPKCDFAEHVNIESGRGPTLFCMSIAIPLLATRCILERKPIIDFL